MWQLQLAAVAAVILRILFFIASRKFRIEWWAALVAEVLFLGGIWIWASQLQRVDLLIVTVAASAAMSAAITKIRGAWTPVAIAFLLAQIIVTYALFAVSDEASSHPGECIWPGQWNESIQECDYL
ncbi:hypothetical protein [Rhodococcus sp. SGAir0479]|uniref:hypothetical protein n=1 Tax=Rhodococcus sp. SGAir0479 TaxID=2567884 RepID=UPI0010CCDD6D|nr:hypothetical protein [Rhodococcus sp. SGAir0479]QCQ94129.1 hypothetical protein E7742_22715 [Rhodococcus sp. SGAir0479]